MNAARDELARDLRFGPMAQFMRGGWDESARMEVAGSVADDLLASGWVSEARQQPRCGDCNTCPCQRDPLDSAATSPTTPADNSAGNREETQ